MLRNEAGKTVGGLTEGLTSCSALHAQPEAAIRGLKLVAGLGYRRMIMETDSQILNLSIYGRVSKRAWTILPIALEIRHLSSSLDVVDWGWISRSDNRAAHAAAMIGSRAVAQCCWADRPPLSLVCEFLLLYFGALCSLFYFLFQICHILYF